ncbi:MAG: glycosyltransferase family 8 protein [Oscillospiraceae bacterium]|nr:glycosyltransferase family 8 protein [Oscillospiraceae bacterium]
MSIIPIFFTVDEGYAPYLDCAIRSMVDNASEDNEYVIYVLHQDLTDDSIEKITTGVRHPFSIEFIKMEDELHGIVAREENKLRCDYFTLTIYFRIFIADMFPQYDKGIYIDSDIIVPGDISELYNTDLDGNIIGACCDRSIQGVPDLVFYTENAVGTASDDYINSGILLMDLKLMRDKHFSEHFLNLMNEYHFDTVAPDQDYINAMCNGNIKYLSDDWDTMPPQGGEVKLNPNPKLIHFNLFQKPWCYDNIPYEEYFWKYAEKSPFKNDILQFKANYDESKQKADSDTLMKLISKASVLDKNEITFKKVYESGVKVRI